MNPSIKDALSNTAKDLGMSFQEVQRIYRSYWKSIRGMLQELPLLNSDEEDLKNLRLSVNIPSLGKLYTNSMRIRGVKKRFEYLHKLKEYDCNKETEANV